MTIHDANTALPSTAAPGKSLPGIPCVHCQGQGRRDPVYEEPTGWSPPRRCDTCGGSGRITTVEQYLKTLPADFHQDSSLERWFPLTAEELARLKAENARLTRLTTVIPALVALIERCAKECAECGGAGQHLKEQPSADGATEDCPDCADLRSGLDLAQRAALAV